MDLVAMLALAVALVAGPLFTSAVGYATGDDAAPTSLAFVATVVVATVVAVAISYGVATVLAGTGDDPGTSGIGAFYKWAVVAGLLFLAVDAAVRRHRIGAPGGLVDETGPDGALRRGVLTTLATPVGVVVLLAAGEVLVLAGQGLWQAWPLWVLTAVLLSVPLAAGGLTGERRGEALPELGAGVERVAWLLRLVATGLTVVVLVTSTPA